MSRYSTPDHPLSSGWWDELRRTLRLRPAPSEEPGPEGLAALFVRKRHVRPREITTCYLTTPEYVPHVADRLKNARPVIINIEEMEPEQRWRALDFLSGIVYALDGSYEKVGEYVFLLVPGSVSIADEEDGEE